jgi:hypothetical protein
MRAAVVCLALAACTPEIVSGAYMCGPDASCPGDLRCNGTEDKDANLLAETCVLPSIARPFDCKPTIELEPDNTMSEAFAIPNLGCVSAPFVSENCMLTDDAADWVKFVAPAACTAVEVEARLSFPLAYEELGLELWDLDRNMMLVEESACTAGAEGPDERRCLDFTLVPGTSYGIKVHPTGQGACDGACAHNRYTLRVQLATPG